MSTHDNETHDLCAKIRAAVTSAIESVPNKEIRLTVNVMITGMNGHIMIGDDAMRAGKTFEIEKYRAVTSRRY
jgi:hypothetical protein